MARDKRFLKTQNIEFSPFAPDIVEEVFSALELIQVATGRSWFASSEQGIPLEKQDEESARRMGKSLLDGPAEKMSDLEVFATGVENSSRPVLLHRARRAYKAYRHLLRYYAVRELITYFAERPDMTFQDATDILSGPRVREWENLGGQLAPREKVEVLLSQVKAGEISGWDEMHQEYQKLWAEYPLDKAQHAWATLCDLLEIQVLESTLFSKELERFMETTRFIEEQVYLTRRKDYTNPFRKATYRGEEEMKAVVGTPESASFVKQIRTEMERWRARADSLLSRFGNGGDQ